MIESWTPLQKAIIAGVLFGNMREADVAKHLHTSKGYVTDVVKKFREAWEGS